MTVIYAKANHTMSSVRRILASLTILLLAFSVHAQKDGFPRPVEVRASGHKVHEQQVLRHFDSLEIAYIHGKVEVEIGGTESTLDIQLDDNLRTLLQVEEKDGALKLSFRDSKGAPIWAIDASITIILKTPTLKALVYNANGTLNVTNLRSDKFSLHNKANGRVILAGSVTDLELVNAANGYVAAEALLVQQANVVSMANGTVRVQAKKMTSLTSRRGGVVNVADNP